MKENIVLIGMPGAGKSTVGVILAKTLGYDFVDTDLLLSRQMGGSPLQEILRRQGLDAFLEAEGALGANLYCRQTVIATGGSMVFSSEAMKHLTEIGDVVYLEVAYPELERRIRNIKTRGIAFAPGETLHDLYLHRLPLYQKYGEIVISCTGNLEEAVAAIVAARR